MSHSPAGNNADVASVCRLVPSLLNMIQLSTVFLDRAPFACVGHTAWQVEGLLLPPSNTDVPHECWTVVLKFLRVRGCCARSRIAPPNPAAASLTTFAGAPRHVVCARRRICSCRPRPLQLACVRCAAPRAAGGHAVAALPRTCGAAGQAIPWQRAAAAAVLRQPPVRPADPPRRCCRPQRALQRTAQIYRLYRQALLQRRRAQALAQS
jgi:hypothetical protein